MGLVEPWRGALQARVDLLVIDVGLTGGIDVMTKPSALEALAERL